MSTYPGPNAAANPRNPAEHVISDEHNPLLTRTNSTSNGPTTESNLPTAALPGAYIAISVMMLGVFLGQVDSTLVLATYSHISSEFSAFDQGTWILSAFIIAQCAAQPLYGQLSDIYGRKACLQVASLLFVLGTVGTATAQSFAWIVGARAVQGVGGAGMGSLVSIIIADLVPLKEVGSVRSYVNVMQTTGRSCGGAVGGLLTQWLGWRWAFGIQVPLLVVAIGLVQWRLRLPARDVDGDEETRWEKLSRVDFVGAFFLCASVSAFCVVLDVGGAKLAWTSPTIIGLGIAGAVCLIVFIVTANYVAEPIFPIRLVKHMPVLTNYLMVFLCMIAQMSLMMVVPLTFQATAKSSLAATGVYLIPAFAGNTIGGLLSGWWIRRTGQYKPALIISPIMGLIGSITCYLFWDGTVPLVDMFATFPGGFSMGVVYNAAFVGLAAGVSHSDIALAGNGMYFFYNFGGICATGIGTAVYQDSLKAALYRSLLGTPTREKIIRKTLADISFVQNASEELRARIVPAFVYAFHRVNVLGISCLAIALFIAVFSEGKRLPR